MILAATLIAASFYWQSGKTGGISASAAPPEAGARPAAQGESRQALLQALPALCENRDAVTGTGFDEADDRGVIVWRQARAGIKNARRLLPLAKRLTLEALRETGADYRVRQSGAHPGERGINSVRRIRLDSRLGDSGAVRDDRPREIRVGASYAMYLTSDDEALLLLAHELTHVAAWSGKLRDVIEGIARRSKLTAGVTLTGRQKEDLACEFIALKVVKRYVELEPTGESKVERLSRVLEYEPPSERLRFAWDDFCFSYYGEHGYRGDDEHLSNGETRRALRELDPELGALIPPDPSPPSPP